MKLYHGSNEKLKIGEFLKIKFAKSKVAQPNGKGKPAIFATPHKNSALDYSTTEAPFQLFVGVGKKVFILSDEIPNIYIYELEDEGFKKLDGNYYVKYTDAKIIGVEKVSIEDLKKLGYEIRIIKKSNIFHKAIMKARLNTNYKDNYDYFLKYPQKFETVMEKYTTKAL
jgi:hypothetical protein